MLLVDTDDRNWVVETKGRGISVERRVGPKRTTTTIVRLVSQLSKSLSSQCWKRSSKLAVLLGEIGKSDGDEKENGDRTPVPRIIAVPSCDDRPSVRWAGASSGSL